MILSVGRVPAYTYPPSCGGGLNELAPLYHALPDLLQ